MKSKTCKECGKQKTLAEFYARAGFICKLCYCARVKLRRVIKAEQVSAYESMRNKRPERQAHLQANAKRWIKRYPERYRAHNAANNALRDGKMKRRPCQICGSKEHVHKHHPDYSRPLDVIWLCPRCHQRGHHP